MGIRKIDKKCLEGAVLKLPDKKEFNIRGIMNVICKGIGVDTKISDINRAVKNTGANSYINVGGISNGMFVGEGTPHGVTSFFVLYGDYVKNDDSSI